MIISYDLKFLKLRLRQVVILQNALVIKAFQGIARTFVYPIVKITRFMIIKHGRHTLGEIHEARKGMWAFCS